MNKAVEYIREVKTELTKVVWPSRRDTVKTTFIVIAFSVAVAVFLGLADFGLNELIQYIFTR
jgi:preprotein translocase subunit SecE